MHLISMQSQHMKADVTTRAMCEAVDEQIDATSQEVSRVLIYPAIETLKHELLDELAWQFDISGYSVNLDILQKISLVKNALKVHRYVGTAYSVKSALSSLYKNAWIEEWFNFGGDPFTFKVLVDYLGDTKDDNMQSMRAKIIEVINQTKNVRSLLVGVNFIIDNQAYVSVGAYHQVATAVTISPYVAKNINQSLVIKTGAKINYANTTTIKIMGGAY